MRKETSCMYLVTAAGLGLFIGAVVHGASPKGAIAPPSDRAERLEFDAKLNQWVPTTRPVAGTADGDLLIARQSMAKSEYTTAIKALDIWIKTYGPDSPRYPEALYLKGTAYLETGDYRAAQDTFQLLLNNYPGSEYAERTLSAQFRVGEQYLAGKRRKALKGLIKIKDREGGLKIMDDMITNYADTPLAEQAQLSKANYYYERGEFDLAEEEYARFSREYPRSRYQSKALLWSGYSALAAFPGIKFDDAKLIEADERFRQFQSNYPDQARQLEVSVLLEQIASTRADKALDIARYYEKTGATQAARFYYQAIIRRWPGTPAAAQAEGCLTSLREKVEVKEILPAPVVPAHQNGESGLTVPSQTQPGTGGDTVP